MKITGIICELNPPHNGHAYLVEKAKQITNCDYVIALMSGNFVQRGSPAIYDYQTRARMALNIGFDAVIYLPTAYSICSANDFAKYNTLLANSLNLDYLAFGVEKSPEELFQLQSIMQVEPPYFSDTLASKLQNGYSYATAYMQTLEAVSGILHISPNDILAIQYMLHLTPSITPMPIKRIKNISATQLRQEIFNNKPNKIQQNVSPENYEIIRNTTPFNITNYKTFIHNTLLTKTKTELSNIKYVNEGLENKITNALNNTFNFDDFNDQIKNKRYTQNYLNRMYFNIALNINKSLNYTLPYIKMVAVKNVELLKYLKCKLPLIADLKSKTLLEKESIYSIDTIANKIYNNLNGQPNTPFPFHKLIKY